MDQTIQPGQPVIVWRDLFNKDNFTVATYQRFNNGHWAGGVMWKHACRIADLVELSDSEESISVPSEASTAKSLYTDAWVKAYATSGDEKVADAALVAFKTREANGDFDK